MQKLVETGRSYDSGFRNVVSSRRNLVLCFNQADSYTVEGNDEELFLHSIADSQELDASCSCPFYGSYVMEMPIGSFTTE